MTQNKYIQDIVLRRSSHRGNAVEMARTANGPDFGLAAEVERAGR